MKKQNRFILFYIFFFLSKKYCHGHSHGMKDILINLNTVAYIVDRWIFWRCTHGCVFERISAQGVSLSMAYWSYINVPLKLILVYFSQHQLNKFLSSRSDSQRWDQVFLLKSRVRSQVKRCKSEFQSCVRNSALVHFQSVVGSHSQIS